MSLVNVAYAPALTWADPRAVLLETQALTPMFGTDPIELGLKGKEARIVALLANDATYRRLTAAAFPGESVELAHITKALAAFERTIISTRSPYDRYQYGGAPNAISDAAKRGERLFFSSEKAGCFQCHGGWNFSGPIQYAGGPPIEAEFLNTGLYLRYLPPNEGLARHSRRTEDEGRFRVPTLRNIAVTGPYMHDGSLPTLEAVVDHYVRGGRSAHPGRSKILRPLLLTQEERRDLIQFLYSLTDEELLRDPRWADPWPRH